MRIALCIKLSEILPVLGDFSHEKLGVFKIFTHKLNAGCTICS